MTPKEKNQASTEKALHLLIKGPKEPNLAREHIESWITINLLFILFAQKLIFILTLVAIKKIQSLIQRDKDMSKHPNLTSGPLINGAGIVSKTFSWASYHLNIQSIKKNYNIIRKKS